MFNLYQNKRLFFPKRLVFFPPGEGGPQQPTGPTGLEQAAEQKEKPQEAPKQELDARDQIYNKLTMKDAVDIVDPATKKPDAKALRKALSNDPDVKTAALAMAEMDKKSPNEKVDPKKAVDAFVAHLMDRMGEIAAPPPAPAAAPAAAGNKPANAPAGGPARAPVVAPNVKISNQNKDVTSWLQQKNVASFKIVEGKWQFMDKDKQPIAFSTDLDSSESAMDAARSAWTDKNFGQHHENVTVYEKAQADKAEQTRLQPENLEKATSSMVPLAEITNLDGLTTALEKAQNPVTIKAAEIRTALLNYLKDEPVTEKDAGKVDEAKFQVLMAALKQGNYEQVGIENGKLVFTKKDGAEKTSSPIVRFREGKPLEAFAHEALIARQAAKNAEEQKAREPKPTRLDQTEKDVAKLLDLKDLGAVDKRYLPAMEQMLKYVNGGPTAKMSIPFNDAPLECEFFLAVNGAYILKYGPQAYDQFTPKAKGPDGLKEAQLHFASKLQNGVELAEIQDININNKGYFEAWGMVVDAGPKKVADNAVKYEFDWHTGLGHDPDVTIKALAHGELAVTVDQRDVATDGKGGPYEFQAGGFQDMIRKLESLRKYAESPSDKRDQMRAEENDRRFFDQDRAVLQTLAGSEAGKLLQVNSVGEAKKVGDSTKSGSEAVYGNASMRSGFYLDFDWMQKLEPAQRVQIAAEDGGTYRVSMEPSGQLLGRVPGKDAQEAFVGAGKLIAAQRERMTTNGGETMGNEKLMEAIKTSGQAELAKDVQIRAISGAADRGGLVYLALGPDTVGKPFRLFNPDGTPNADGIKLAVDQGYLRQMVAEPKPLEDQPPLWLEKVSPILGTGEKHDVPDQEAKSAAAKEFDAAIKPLKNGNELRWAVFAQLDALELTGNTPEEKKQSALKICWETLGKLTGIEPSGPDGWKSPKFQREVKAVIDKPDAAKSLENSFDYSPLTSEQLAKYPRVKGYLVGLDKAFESNAIKLGALSTFGGDEEKWKAFKKEYFDTVKAELQKILNDPNSYKDKASKTDDGKIISTLRDRIKYPREFDTEYFQNENNKESWFHYNAAHPHYEEEQKQYQQQKEAYDRSQDSNAEPNLMSFAQFKEATMSELGVRAMNIFGNTKMVKQENVSLANTPGNAPTAENVMVFNVNVGTAPNFSPMTIRMWKEGGDTYVAGNFGRNNPVMDTTSRTMVAGVGNDPLKQVISYLDSVDSNSRMTNPTAAGAKTEAAPGAKPGETPSGTKNAPTTVAPDKPASAPPAAPAATSPAGPAAPGNVPANKPPAGPTVPPAPPAGREQQPTVPPAAPPTIPIASAPPAAPKRTT